jgi:hypothetical protein
MMSIDVISMKIEVHIVVAGKMVDSFYTNAVPRKGDIVNTHLHGNRYLVEYIEWYVGYADGLSSAQLHCSNLYAEDRQTVE